MSDLLSKKLHALVCAAKECGATADSISSAFLAAIDKSFGRASAKALVPQFGFRTIMSAEGGCVDAKEAGALYGGSRAMTAHAVRAAARKGRLISVRDRRGHLLFPRWQFSDRGGALPHLHELLQILRRSPNYTDLTPVVFLLNPSARLAGKRPLDVLRTQDRGGLEVVRRLAAEKSE